MLLVCCSVVKLASDSKLVRQGALLPRRQVSRGVGEKERASLGGRYSIASTSRTVWCAGECGWLAVC